MAFSVVVLVILLFVFYKYLKRSFSESEKSFESIPGPKGIPLLGNIQDYFYSDEELWRIIRARAVQFYPIYKLKMFNKKIVHLIDPTDIEVILNDKRCMSKGPLYDPLKLWIGNGLLLSEGEAWRRERKLLTKSFHFGALPKYMQTFNDGVEHLTKSLDSGEKKPSNLTQRINSYTFKIAIDALVGKLDLTYESSERYLRALKTLTRIAGIKVYVPFMNILYRFTKLKKEEENATKIFRGFAMELSESKSIEDDDELNELRFLKILQEKIDKNSRGDEMTNFIFAGQDTTATSLIFILYILANKLHFQEEIYKEILQVSQNETPTHAELSQMAFLDRFIRECLRLFPPAPFIGRTSKEDISLPSGYTIPAETLIFIDIFDVHRNPNIHHEPKKVDPDRFLPENIRKRHPYSFLPFSAGPRNCIAQKFSYLEMKTTICGILKKFHIDPVGSVEDIVLVPDVLLKTKYPLNVIFRRRSV